MLFRTHFVIAFSVFLLIYNYFDNAFLFGLFFLFSTLIVDVDTKNSKMGKIFIFRPLQFFSSHRGLFHSLFIGIIISSLIFVLNVSAGFGFLFGYIVHLILDCFSLSGICLFWPISSKKFKGFIKTGGIFEEVLFVFFLIFDLYLVGKIALNILSWTI